MSDLTEALVRNEEVFEPTWEESLLFADAARKWADLETLVADGGRVVVEEGCADRHIFGCCDNGLHRRIVLGEGAE